MKQTNYERTCMKTSNVFLNGLLEKSLREKLHYLVTATGISIFNVVTLYSLSLKADAAGEKRSNVL